MEPVDYKEGQIWKYNTRELETSSEVRILKIDDTGVHISLNNLKIKNPEAPAGYSSSISHLPIMHEYFSESVVELLRTEEAFEEDYLSGYEVWLQQSAETDDVGYFTMEIAEAVELMEVAVNQGV